MEMSDTRAESRYPEEGHQVLQEMHQRHFWYRGRRRFLRAALGRVLDQLELLERPLHVADLGGGNGNWLAYLSSAAGKIKLGRRVLADASARALADAEQIVGPDVEKVRADLTAPLLWGAEFDVVFLLDVIEHFRDDQGLLRRVSAVLRPGGVCVISVPAIPAFWSWVDETAGHFRRYRLRELRTLAAGCGMQPLLLRYFCFFLSPLYLAARTMMRPGTTEAMESCSRRLHRVPPAWLNGILTAMFYAETPLGIHVPLPWGTSAVGVFRVPLTSIQCRAHALC